MNIRPVRGLLLSIMLIWMIQTVAQDRTYQHYTIELSDSVIGVDHGTILRRLAWGAMLLIDSDDRYELVPLFGYPVEEIEDRLSDLSVEVAASNVRLAILTPAEDDTYTGRGVRISTHVSPGSDAGTGDDLSLQWDHILRDHPSAMVAFTRPLRGMEPTEQFVAGNLWANWSDEPSDTSAPTDDGN